MRWPQWTWVIALIALGGTARAEDGHVRERLRVEPGATCLTAEQLVLEIEPLLDEPRIPEELTFVVEGSSIDPRNAHLRVVRQGRTVAERAFRPGPERCRSLHAAVGLAIALAINAAQEDERARTRAWSVYGAALWSYRVLPQFSPGAELFARRALGEHALVRAGVTAVFAFDEPLSSQGTFDATLLAARIEGCGRSALSRALRADGCLGLLAGALHVAGDGVASASSAEVPWVALAATAALELEVSDRWAAFLGFSAHALLHRVEIGLEDAAGMRAQSRTLDRVGIALAVGPVYYF